MFLIPGNGISAHGLLSRVSVIDQTKKSCCDRCGACCLQGGPALHREDLALLREGHLSLADLVTIRKGELAYQPLADTPTLVTKEFLKVSGRQGSWTCHFYDEPGRACTIYDHRPVACGLFDCTAPEPILQITGRNLLTRFDCAGKEDPLAQAAREHEQRCPCPDLAELTKRLRVSGERKLLLADLSPLVNADLAFRRAIAQTTQLSLAEELFWFGRPLFQLLLPLGIQVRETTSGLLLS